MHAFNGSHWQQRFSPSALPTGTGVTFKTQSINCINCQNQCKRITKCSRTSHFLNLKKDLEFLIIVSESSLWINLKQHRFSPQFRMPFELNFALTKVCCCHRSISCHYTVELRQFHQPKKHPHTVHVNFCRLDTYIMSQRNSICALALAYLHRHTIRLI